MSELNIFRLNYCHLLTNISLLQSDIIEIFESAVLLINVGCYWVSKEKKMMGQQNKIDKHTGNSLDEWFIMMY